MSKVVVLGDVHFGVREDKEVFHKYFSQFFLECLFPEMKKRGITQIIQLGDLFDRRKYINFVTLKRSKEYFFDQLQANGFFMQVLVGNHDIAHRNTCEVNSPELLLSDYHNIEVITEPTECFVDGVKSLIIPWICASNYDRCLEMIKRTDARYCFGHFEITGFQMYRGSIAHDGLDQKVFSKFEHTFSGHYHHRSTIGNIHYVGAPCEHTHMDQGDIRGFDILDTDTGEIEFVKNPFTMFERFVYNDEKVKDHALIDVSTFSEKFVKIIVEKKTDYYAFDTFLQKVYASGAYDVKVMDTVAEMTTEEMDESIDIEDTQTILGHFIDTTDTDVNRSDLKTYVNRLYIEALHTDF